MELNKINVFYKLNPYNFNIGKKEKSYLVLTALACVILATAIYFTIRALHSHIKPKTKETATPSETATSKVGESTLKTDPKKEPGEANAPKNTSTTHTDFSNNTAVQDALDKVMITLSAGNKQKFEIFKKGFQQLPDAGSFICTFGEHKSAEFPNGKEIPPKWMSQGESSQKSGFPVGADGKTDMERNTEAFLKSQGKIAGFLWVNLFSNAYDSIPGIQPPIQGIDYHDNVEKKFHNSEFLYQHIKMTALTKLLPDGDEKQRFEKYLFDGLTDPSYAGDGKVAQSFGRASISTFSDVVWNKEAKIEAMNWVLYLKFQQYPLLKALLILTTLDDRILVQMKTDGEWGTGCDGEGDNLLGKCLMEVRLAFIENREIPPFNMEAFLKKHSA